MEPQPAPPPGPPTSEASPGLGDGAVCHALTCGMAHPAVKSSLTGRLICRGSPPLANPHFISCQSVPVASLRSQTWLVHTLYHLIIAGESPHNTPRLRQGPRARFARRRGRTEHGWCLPDTQPPPTNPLTNLPEPPGSPLVTPHDSPTWAHSGVQDGCVLKDYGVRESPTPRAGFATLTGAEGRGRDWCTGGAVEHRLYEGDCVGRLGELGEGTADVTRRTSRWWGRSGTGSGGRWTTT